MTERLLPVYTIPPPQGCRQMLAFMRSPPPPQWVEVPHGGGTTSPEALKKYTLAGDLIRAWSSQYPHGSWRMLLDETGAKAEVQLEQAVALDPDFAAAWNDLAMVAVTLRGNPQEAVRVLKNAPTVRGYSDPQDNLRLFAAGQMPPIATAYRSK